MAQDEPSPTIPSLQAHTVDAAVARERVRAELFGSDFSAPRLGRFAVLERIGQGGMGVVFAGYDAELERKVAIKIIRRDGARDRVRLLREARAMAQLSDPHVVAIYEVGEHDDRVWIAMEFVDGMTLTRWVAADPGRPWRQTLATFLQAAKGLQAAHARDIVHRDFKPDNALISTQGVVKVVDFGLARAVTTAVTEDDQLQRRVDVEDVEHASSITSSGALAGTPAYMAPEQFQNAAIDARADQFAFCVGLWEALYGEPPFRRESFASLVIAVQNGDVRAPPSGSPIPARIERVLRRGLSPRPDDRFADMAALVGALQHEPMRRARGVAVIGLAVLATGALAYGLGRGERPSPCVDVAELPGWDADTRARLEARIVDPAVGAPAETWELLERALDRYRDAWLAERADACAATHVRGEQSEQALDLRRACTDRRARELGAVIARLEHADAAALEHAITAVGRLPSPSGCADAEQLDRRPPPPTDPDALAVWMDAEARIAEAAAAFLLGDDAAAAPLAEAAVAAAQSIERRDLEAEAKYQLGKIQIDQSQLEAAGKNLDDAFWAARGSGHDRIAAQAAADLAELHANSEPEVAASWAKHAQVEVDRLGDRDELRGRLLTTLGVAAMRARDLDRAQTLHAEALAIFERVEGPDGIGVAVCAFDLGTVAFMRGDDDDTTRAYIERALDIWREHLGPEHPMLAQAHGMLGNMAHRGGRLDEAQTEYERALGLLERAYGPNHIDVTDPLNGLALVAQDRGELDRAIALFERAIAVSIANTGAPDVRSATFESNLADVLSTKGRHEDALAHQRHVLEVFTRVFGPGHRGTSDSLSAIGQELLALDRPAEAVEPLERALALRIELEAPPRYRWRPRFALARALAGSGADRRRALELARTAREEVLATDDHEPLVEIDAFLKRVDATPPKRR